MTTWPFGLSLRKYSKEDIIDKRVNEGQKSRLEGILQRKPADLSGGFSRQRVGRGRAIVRNAKVFLWMSLCLTSGCVRLRVSMRAEIAKIHRRIGATTIYVTHDQTEAMTLADRSLSCQRPRILLELERLDEWNRLVHRRKSITTQLMPGCRLHR